MTSITEALRPIVARLVEEELAKRLQPDEFLTPAIAARTAGVSSATIRRWIRKGDLMGYRKERTLRVKRAELEALLKGTRAKNDSLTPEQMADRMFG